MLTIKDLIKENNQDGSIFVVAPWDYEALYHEGDEAATAPESFIGYDYVMFPILNDGRWFILIICTRNGRILCFDSLHQMRYDHISFIANYFKTHSTCQFGTVVCPKTIPYEKDAKASGMLVLGVAKKFLNDPEAAAQAAMLEDAGFHWDAKPHLTRLELLFRLAPEFHDACKF